MRSIGLLFDGQTTRSITSVDRWYSLVETNESSDCRSFIRFDNRVNDRPFAQATNSSLEPIDHLLRRLANWWSEQLKLCIVPSLDRSNRTTERWTKMRRSLTPRPVNRWAERWLCRATQLSLGRSVDWAMRLTIANDRHTPTVIVCVDSFCASEREMQHPGCEKNKK